MLPMYYNITMGIFNISGVEQFQYRRRELLSLPFNIISITIIIAVMTGTTIVTNIVILAMHRYFGPDRWLPAEVHATEVVVAVMPTMLLKV